MKIALIVPGGVDQSGRKRIIPALLWLIEHLARQHSVIVFTTKQYPDPRRYLLFGAEIINLGYAVRSLPGTNLITNLWDIYHELRYIFDADILHAFWANTPGFLAVCVGKLLDKPVVVSVAGGELVKIPEILYGSQISIFRSLQIDWTLKAADRVTGGSRFLLDKIKKRNICPDLIPLGVNTELLNASVLREDGPPWNLIHVGSINLVKNQRLLLEAFQLVLDHGVDAYLDWVGEDTLHGELQTYLANLRLQDRVRFHGFLELEDIFPLYKRAHLFIQSSVYEAQGVAVCEAAAMGVPTIGTNVGIVADLSPHSAIAIPINDKNILAGEIVRLLQDSKTRRKIAYKAQSWAQTYNSDWTASSFLAIYTELINQRGGRL